jgi:Leucine-rich repeat (LRR) protein
VSLAILMPDLSEFVLDPWVAIPIQTEKGAKESVEIFLANRGGNKISDQFSRFPNVEVVWLNSNRLLFLNNLQSNFRIQEIYVQDNHLVSLEGIRHLKFLRVLLASNNHLRNLDKQLSLLKKLAFLKKLDLFGNPLAEEPDYRLRCLFFVPQLDILDRHVIKDECSFTFTRNIPLSYSSP